MSAPLLLLLLLANTRATPPEDELLREKLRQVAKMVQKENWTYSLVNATDNVSDELKRAVLEDERLVHSRLDQLLNDDRADAPTSDGICTLARLAAIKGRVEVAEALLKQGFGLRELDFKRAPKGSPTSLVVLLYDLARVKALSFYLQQGGQLDHVDDNLNTPLHVAAVEENWFLADVLIERMVRQGEPHRNFVNKDGLSTLHIVSAGMSSRHVNLFLMGNARVDAAVSPESRFRPGYTALHFAAERCRPETVKLLIEAGANPRLLNKDGKTAEELMCKPGWLLDAKRDEL